MTGGASGERSTSWVSVLADREYAALWAAYVLSLAGDQLARVALAVLVFDTTGSALATAGAYAVTFLPWVVGGPLLAGFGDRYPRRTVLLVCDAVSAVLVAVMALPGLGLVALCVLLFLVVLLAAPFTAARSSLVRDMFPDDDRYGAATALTTVTIQGSQVAGFAAGGLLVAALGSRGALLLNSASFVLSAGLILLLVRRRPAAAAGRGGYWGEIVAGGRLVFGDPRLRVLAFYAWLATFHSVPAGVVVPYVSGRGGGPATIGLLLAAVTFGSAASMVGLARWVPSGHRVRLMPPLALLASAALIPCLLDPPLLVVGLLWMAAGAGTGYQLAANVAFVSAVPAERRAQAFGLVGAGLAAGQGLGLVAAGALTELLSPYVVVGLAGVAGTAVTLLLLAAPASRLALSDVR